jgi:hypothetical protein
MNKTSENSKSRRKNKHSDEDDFVPIEDSASDDDKYLEELDEEGGSESI